MKTYYRYLLLMLMLTASHVGRSAQQFVFFNEGDFCLNAKFPVLIYLDDNDERGVGRAAHDLATDIERVCGFPATITADEQSPVVVGTLGHSKAIDKLVREGVINKKDLNDYFPAELLRQEVMRPFGVAGCEGKFDVIALVGGGGLTGQAGALRHGISRALCEADREAYRAPLKAAGFLKAYSAGWFCRIRSFPSVR